MKLSEAMMLGATTKKLGSGSWNTCLLGVSVHAVGGRSGNAFNYEAELRWPWITRTAFPWPDLDSSSLSAIGVIHTFKTIISHLSAEVEKGHISLEQVVDWVASVEPPEAVPEGAGETPAAAESMAVSKP